VNTAAGAQSVVPNRLPIYGVLNFAFIVYVVVASASGSNANPRLLYLMLLFAICSSPVLLLRKGNDKFALYAIFFVIYFVSFGVIDLFALTSGPGNLGTAAGPLSAPELLILLGGLAFSMGYRLSTQRQQPSSFAVNDWPMNTLVIVGLLLWTAGTYATWYWNIRLTVRAGEFHAGSSQIVTTILMLGRYVQPLGLMILAYAYTINKSRLLALIVIALAIYQVYLGFVSDTKGGAMLGGILVIVTGFLVTGKIPKAWAVAGVLFIVLAFPVFQAHRSVVVGERGISNAKSADDFGRALQLSLEGQKRAKAEHAQSFFERSSVKSAVEMIVNKTGAGVPYQHGYTLLPLVTAFIPRLIWPDKLDVQTGVLVNKEFDVTGDGVTYISPSHLGELYWNFGWIGALMGMLLVGLLFGWINRLCDLSTGRSVTRLLILAVTITQLGVRFEASIATEYAVWIRSIVAVLLLHWAFARRGATPPAAADASSTNELAPTRQQIDFPNLLR
jgi:hypothetical protein